MGGSPAEEGLPDCPNRWYFVLSLSLLSSCTKACWTTALQGISLISAPLYPRAQPSVLLPSAPSPLHPRGPGSSLLGMTHTLLTPLSPSTALLCNWRSCCLNYLLELANTGSDFNRYKGVDRGKSPSAFSPSLALRRTVLCIC